MKIEKKHTLVIQVILAFILCGFIIGKVPWVSPQEADSLVNPYAKNFQSIKAGSLIYAQQCVICHGEKGKGDGIAAIGLDTKPANFTLDKIQNNTDGSLFWKLTSGRTPMPSFRMILTNQQRWQVINYIREFKPRNITAKKRESEPKTLTAKK